MMRKIKMEHTSIKSVYTLALGNKAHLLEELHAGLMLDLTR